MIGGSALAGDTCDSLIHFISHILYGFLSITLSIKSHNIVLRTDDIDSGYCTLIHFPSTRIAIISVGLLNIYHQWFFEVLPNNVLYTGDHHSRKFSVNFPVLSFSLMILFISHTTVSSLKLDSLPNHFDFLINSSNVSCILNDGASAFTDGLS